MKEDIIKIVAKNTFTEIKEELKDPSDILIPWAIIGVLLVSWQVFILLVIFQFAITAYYQYKELMAADEAAESVLPVKPVQENNVQSTDTSTDKK